MANAVGYHLPSDCSIAQIDVLRRDLANLLEAGDTVNLHGEAVSRIDAVGVQLLLAFVMAMGARGVQWHWVEPSARLCTAARLLGLCHPLKFS